MKVKKYLRSFVFNSVSLWLAAQLIEGVFYQGGYQTLFLTALALTLTHLLVKPLVKLLLLPVNLITMGAFRWLINVISLYLVILFVPQFKISAFLFPGFNYQGLIVPPVQLGFFWALLITSFFLSIVTSLLFWLAK